MITALPVLNPERRTLTAGQILFAMFCLGLFTLLAQMIVVRELAVVCLGNELTIGVVLSVWLLLIGAGAGVGTRRGSKIAPHSFIWLAFALPLVMIALRLGAGLVRPPGEYVSLERVFLAAFTVLLPICLPAGMIFPRACGAYAAVRGPGAVRKVYAIESLGSVLAGAAFSFILIDLYGLGQLAVLASGIILFGAAGVLSCCRYRGLLLAGAGVLIVAALAAPCIADFDARTALWRWDALGVTHDGQDGRPAVTLKQSCESRYQNLALMESQGQYTLYGDGEVMFAFPDAIACEQNMHFVMAQNPKARRVLLLGGNPAGELPWLLKYPVSKVVHVERDPGIGQLVGTTAIGTIEALRRDSRLVQVEDDGPHYVKSSQDGFDVVLVHAPEPVTGGLNRYFTVEFYHDVDRILTPNGFVHTSIEASELLEGDSVRVAGSVFAAMSSVFPVVKVTAGPPLQFFAAKHEGVVTLDREVLYQESRREGPSGQTFNSLYFLDCDELAPDKVEAVRRRLQASHAPVNTLAMPVSSRSAMVLWSQFSGSRLGVVLRYLEVLNPLWVTAGIIVVGLISLMMPHVIGRKTVQSGAIRAAWQAMAMTGLGCVALELMLLYAFQGLHGYVYGWIGFMVALFMFGTVVGAWSGRWLEGCQGNAPRAVAAMVLGVLLIVAVLLGLSMKAGWIPVAMIYAATLVAGAAAGLQFVVVTRWLMVEGIQETKASGHVWLCDYWGSAIGGLLIGVIAVAVWGIGQTCLVLSAAIGLSLFVVLAVSLKK